MIKKGLLLLLIAGLIGCAYEGQSLQTYIDDPKTLIRDPQFSRYKASLDDLESQYLNKEITYAEYIERKEKLDEGYDREVQERTGKMMTED